MGLLSKANLLETNKRLAFSNFLTNYNISFFALFEYSNSEYVIGRSLGFDGVSIISSFSTEDFWNGIIKEDETVYNFLSTDQNNPLLQFFSFAIKDDVKSISVCRFKDKKIFLLCNQIITSNLISDYYKIDFNLKETDFNSLNKYINKDSFLYKIEFDFSEAIETFILTKNRKLNNEIIFNSIFNELSNRILYLYTYPNSGIITDNYKIKSVFICNKKTSKDLLISHLILNIKEVIESSAEITDISFSGNIETYKELESFLFLKED